jgi:hypothetical protein
VNKRTFLKSMGLLAASQWLHTTGFSAETKAAASTAWALNMTALESCSCPVFCPCFFDNPVPETSSTRNGRVVEEHACRFNQTFTVNQGHVGSVPLDGVRFWYAGNGGDMQQPQNEWAVLTFDPSVTAQQRDALLTVLHKHAWFRPASWKTYTIGDDAPIQVSVESKGAHAALGGGAIAETRTGTMFGLQGKPVTIANLDYFGFTRNNGFILMPSEVVAWRKGDDAFEYKNTNGLLTTVDMNSSDEKK